MYIKDIKKLARENNYFRKVIYTGRHSQIVVMCIPSGLDIGNEVHPNTDQIIFIEEGCCEAIVKGEAKKVEKHDVIFVPAGTMHNFKNIGYGDLKIFTVYSPPEHKDGTVHKTKADANKSKE
jgi:mannose-6-phosphate isomerase-like protein (cupin superfamily)